MIIHKWNVFWFWDFFATEVSDRFSTMIVFSFLAIHSLQDSTGGPEHHHLDHDNILHNQPSNLSQATGIKTQPLHKWPLKPGVQVHVNSLTSLTDDSKPFYNNNFHHLQTNTNTNSTTISSNSYQTHHHSHNHHLNSNNQSLIGSRGNSGPMSSSTLNHPRSSSSSCSSHSSSSSCSLLGNNNKSKCRSLPRQAAADPSHKNRHRSDINKHISTSGRKSKRRISQPDPDPDVDPQCDASGMSFVNLYFIVLTLYHTTINWKIKYAGWFVFLFTCWFQVYAIWYLIDSSFITITMHDIKMGYRLIFRIYELW